MTNALFSEVADDDTFIVKSNSSDSANTIIRRELQRKHAGEEVGQLSPSQKDGWECFSCGDPSLVLEPHVPNMIDSVVIIGAGAVGGFLGCCLYQGGGDAQVTFLVRDPKHIEHLSLVGFRAQSTIDNDFRARILPEDIRRVFTTDPSCLKDASCVLVATKRTSNQDVHRMLCLYNVTCPVVFLQCGIDIKKQLKETTSETTGEKLGVEYEVIESIVMMSSDFNKHTGIVTLAQAVKDSLVVLDGHQKSAKHICDIFKGSGVNFQVEEKHDFISLQAAKLQTSMMNAVNALSGISVAQTMREPGYRLILAHCIDECRAVFVAHNIRIQAIGNGMSNFRLSLMSCFLRTWNVLFLPLMGSKIELLRGTSSMAQDLNNCEPPTEIDYLNGAVVELGQLAAVPTPVNRKIVELVKRAESLRMGSPKLGPVRLLTEVGLMKGCCPVVAMQEDDAANTIVSLDSLRQDSVDDSAPSTGERSDGTPPFPLGARVRSTLAIAMRSSEELSVVESPPLSPGKADSVSRGKAALTS